MARASLSSLRPSAAAGVCSTTGVGDALAGSLRAGGGGCSKGASAACSCKGSSPCGTSGISPSSLSRALTAACASSSFLLASSLAFLRASTAAADVPGDTPRGLRGRGGGRFLALAADIRLGRRGGLAAAALVLPSWGGGGEGCLGVGLRVGDVLGLVVVTEEVRAAVREG